MGGLIIALWVILMGAASAAAQAEQPSPLAAAEQHLHMVEFDAARDAAHAAVRSGSLDPASLARAYEIIGVSAAAVGNNEEARAAYLRLLALKPDARSSDILPPEKNRVFYDAQGFWYGRTERFELSLARAGPRSVRVTVDDPLGMAERLSFGAVGAAREERLLKTVSGPLELTFPPPPLRLTFELRDAYGNILTRAEYSLEPATAVVTESGPAAPFVATVTAPTDVLPQTAEPRSDQRKSLWRSPWLWGAVSLVVAGAAATTTVLLVRDREPSLRTDVSIAR